MNAMLHRLSSGTVELPNQQVGAAFAEVTYGGNITTLVNIDCSIIHLLLHLRAKCIGDGFDIDSNIQIEGSCPGRYISGGKRRATVTFDEDGDREYMDLLDENAVPVELCHRDPLSIAKKYLKHRGEYMLCSVKKTKDGLIRDARPLLTKPPVDLRQRIMSAIRTMDRFKPIRVEKTKAEPKRKGNKKKQ